MARPKNLTRRSRAFGNNPNTRGIGADPGHRPPIAASKRGLLDKVVVFLHGQAKMQQDGGEQSAPEPVGFV
jgi:hypothetical protein